MPAGPAVAGAPHMENPNMKKIPEPAGKPFTITRTYAAPRARVFQAWTDPERLMQWWGPQGSTMLSARMDLRPGGLFHYAMRIPEGMEIWGRFVFREIVPQERIVCIVSFSDEKGGITRNPWDPDWPLEIQSKMTFSERKGRTTVAVEWIPVNATEREIMAFMAGHADMREGWGGTLDRLESYLAQAAGKRAA